MKSTCTSLDEVILEISKIFLHGMFGLACCISLSCSTASYREVYPILTDGKYDSEFPYRGCSAQLEQISESVRMISCIAYYKSYNFPLEAKLHLRDIQSPFFKEKAEKEVYLNRSASGSATVIYYEKNRIALLTCAHVVQFADTIISYFRGEDRKPTPFIQSVAIKDRQSNYAAAVQGARDLEILALDAENDMAIMGQKLELPLSPIHVPVFNYPLGKAKELEWGAFVYLFGYPAGYRVVTKGIVSNPNRDKYGSFLTDAVFNKGFSGGIILAIRDGVPNFELVGMVKLVPGYQQFYMSPLKEGEWVEFDTDTPYKGDLYVGTRTDIIYGVAPAISAEMIADFIKSQQSQLLEKGYDLGSFLSKQPASQPGVR